MAKIKKKSNTKSQLIRVFEKKLFLPNIKCNIFMDKTIGLDLGTNSIGLLLRNISNGTDILKQIEYFTSVVFKSGVGKEKSGEFSYAAKRTEKRSHRRLYQS